MGATRGLTDKPITKEVILEDGRVVAVHLSNVITDPESADAVQVPSPTQYPTANATGQDPLAVHQQNSPGDFGDADEANVNEVQKFDRNGTISGGTFDFVFLPGHAWEFASDAVPYDITTADLQALIDAGLGDQARDGEGNRNVVLTGGPVSTTDVTITYQNDLGGQNLPELTVEDAALTGSTPVIVGATVTPGVHADA